VSVSIRTSRVIETAATAVAALSSACCGAIVRTMGAKKPAYSSAKSALAAGGSVLALGWLVLSAYGQIAVKNQGYVPFADEPINYRSDDLHDAVTELKGHLDGGRTTLEYEPRHGYLKAVLEKLHIPVSSQTLVFSKTSFQYKKISPQTPRALYFNDDVYVGQVRDGKVLEFVSFDPAQGAIFYILNEQKADHPALQRAELDCTQCHVAAGTRNVPGVLLRSVFTNPSGTEADHAPSYITGHESPLNERWGGWYVTGTHGSARHMGNVVVQHQDRPDLLDREAGANLTSLSKFFDTSAYLAPDSDIVALLVLAHQTQMHNLITVTNYQTRIALYNASILRERRDPLLLKPFPVPVPPGDPAAQYRAPAEELVRYLLFANEAPLEGPIRGTSKFAEEFSARGPRDSKGRSLRDFDLRTRIFKYPCSYLIYSKSFDALPGPAKEYVYHRLFEVLTGRDQSPAFARLTKADRRAVFEILLATKPGLPDEWKTARSQTK
jgi:hypothetical protein